MPSEAEITIRIVDGGPYLVSEAPLARVRPVTSDAGRPVAWEKTGALETQSRYALCRCGQSAEKPFCDGSHKRIEFDSTETADRTSTTERRKNYAGDDIVLTDDKPFCYHAGFCVTETTHVWNMIEETGDPDVRTRIEKMVHNCPTGRLAFHRPDGDEDVEPELEPEVAVIADGPLWVRGGIPVEGADGMTYEVRKRVALCRCGASANKPFCDGSHTTAGFTDA